MKMISVETVIVSPEGQRKETIKSKVSEAIETVEFRGRPGYVLGAASKSAEKLGKQILRRSDEVVVSEEEHLGPSPDVFGDECFYVTSRSGKLVYLGAYSEMSTLGSGAEDVRILLQRPTKETRYVQDVDKPELDDLLIELHVMYPPVRNQA